MKSQLLAIIKRLEAMVETDSHEPQVRRFERDGEERCTVTYRQPNEDDENSTGMFELTETNARQSYQFDDIDIIAMEIYELLQ